VKRYKDRFWEINGLIGNEAAAQIKEVIKKLHIWQNHFSIVGSVTLLIDDYRFGEIQDSINIIWNLKQNQARY
jgi:membrane protein